MNKNRIAQLRDQLAGLSPDDDMYDVLLEEIKMLQGQGMYSKPKKKFNECKKVKKRKLPKTPMAARRRPKQERGAPEGMQKRVRPGLASGVRGTPGNPVGGPETVGMLERLTGKARKKAPKLMENVEKGLGAALGYESGGKVRGAGIARKGVRKCKMR